MNNRNDDDTGNASMDQLRDWMNTTYEQRLQWLEDAREFFDKAMSPEAKKIAEKFRSGEL